MKRVIPLHQNECYWLLDEQLISAIRDGLDAFSFSTYADYDQLKEAIASYASVSKDLVCLTPGSDAGISLIVEHCVRESRLIVLPVPTFYGYERILTRYQAQVTPTYYAEHADKFIFPFEQTISLMQEGTALFLCHPNNPLGCTIPEDQLEKLLDVAAVKNVLVVLDEAYFEFGGTTQLDRLSTQPLVIVRTLSKAFGLSGARIGYILSSPSFAQNTQKLQLPWPIAHTSVNAALTLLSLQKEVEGRRKLVVRERETFLKELRMLNKAQVYDTAANFVLLRIPNASRIADVLKSQAIRVAKTDFMTEFDQAKQLLASTLRLTVPSPDDRPLVIASLQGAIGG